LGLFRAAANALRRPAVFQAEASTDGTSARAVLESAFHLHKTGRLTEAIPLYRSAIVLEPRSDVGYNLLGSALCSQGDLVEGERCFRRALELNDSNVEACNNLANVRKDLGDLLAADRYYRRTLQLDPEFSPAWNNLGLLHLAGGRLDEAATCFRYALAINQSGGEAHNNLGVVLRMQGLMADAEDAFRAAIGGNPGLAEAWCGLGDVLQARGLLDEAEICCNKALGLRHPYADALANLAAIAKARGDIDTAQVYCADALRIAPEHVGALNNVGSIACARQDYAAAQGIYRKALAIDPMNGVTRFNLSTTLLMLGNYAEGFELYESRFEAFHRPFTSSPGLNERLHSTECWRGQPMPTNRLLVWSEQGLGDALMMARYLRAIASRGVASFSIMCDPALGRIIGSVEGVEHVIMDPREAESMEFAAHCPMMSLPLAFGTRQDSIPDSFPYFNVPPAMAAVWKGRLISEKRKVGLVWCGSKSLRDDASRSIDLVRFGPLLALDQFEFISLQKGEASSEWTRLRASGADHITGCHDLLDTAALILNLDLVIAVDTAVAHLASGLGKPVWLLNRYGSEWRWGLEIETSPWYPSLRIFRQPRPMDWDSVIARVAAELTNLA
jgi:tetratricopeptide (TPR) repeat protein